VVTVREKGAEVAMLFCVFTILQINLDRSAVCIYLDPLARTHFFQECETHAWNFSQKKDYTTDAINLDLEA